MKQPPVPLPLDDEAPDRLEPTMSKRIMIARVETPDGRRIASVRPCPRPKKAKRPRKVLVE